MIKKNRSAIAFMLLLCIFLAYTPLPSFADEYPSGDETIVEHPTHGAITARIGWGDQDQFLFSTGGLTTNVTSGQSIILQFAAVVLAEDGSEIKDLAGVVSEAALRVQEDNSDPSDWLIEASYDAIIFKPSDAAVLSTIDDNTGFMPLQPTTNEENNCFTIDMLADGTKPSGDYIVEMEVTMWDGSVIHDWITVQLGIVDPLFIEPVWNGDRSIAKLNEIISDMAITSLHPSGTQHFSSFYNPVYIVIPAGGLTTGGSVEVNLSKPVGLIGENGGETIPGRIRASYGSTTGAVGYYVPIKNLTIDGSEIDEILTQRGIGVYTTDSALQDWNLDNCTVTGFAVGVEALSTSFQVYSATIGACDIGLRISKSAGGAYDIYDDISFIDNRVGIYISNATINSDFYKKFYGIRIIKNYFDDNDVAIESAASRTLYAAKNIFTSTPAVQGKVEASPYYYNDSQAPLRIDTNKAEMAILSSDIQEIDANLINQARDSKDYTVEVNKMVTVNNLKNVEVQGEWFFPQEPLLDGRVTKFEKLRNLVGSLKEFFIYEAYALSDEPDPIPFQLGLQNNVSVSAGLVGSFGDYQGFTVPANPYASAPAVAKMPLNSDLLGYSFNSLTLYKVVNGSLEKVSVGMGDTEGYATLELDTDTDGGTYVIGAPKATIAEVTPTGTLYYNLMFNTDGGSTIYPVRVAAGQAAAKPADPFKAGFTFGGWYQDSELKTTYNFATQINGNTWIYAKWTPIEGYVAFTDLGNHTWAADAIARLSQKGIVTGIGGRQYGPSLQITRGDFILMLYRAFGLTKGTAGTGAAFTDVPAGSYYAEAIEVARSLGIAKGSDGFFRPTERLSREDALVLIYRAMGYKGIAPAAGASSDLAKFSDQGQINNYAMDAAAALVKAGVIQGSGGMLNPDGLLTRAEMAVILNKTLN